MTAVEDLVSSTLPLTLRDTDQDGGTDIGSVRTDSSVRTDDEERTDAFALSDEIEMIHFTPEVQDAIQKVTIGNTE